MRVFITIAAPVAVGLLGVWFAYLAGRDRVPGTDELPPPPTGEPPREPGGDESAVGSRFRDAWRSSDGPQRRLQRLNETSTALASELRCDHQNGETPSSLRPGVRADWKPPYELRRGSPRVPPAAGWQAVERALEALAAHADAPDSTLLSRAIALEQFGRAAQELADSFPSAAPVSAVAVCFCGKRGDQVRKIIAGPFALICEECVDLCVDVLEDKIGEDWRSEPDADLFTRVRCRSAAVAGSAQRD